MFYLRQVLREQKSREDAISSATRNISSSSFITSHPHQHQPTTLKPPQQSEIMESSTTNLSTISNAKSKSRPSVPNGLQPDSINAVEPAATVSGFAASVNDELLPDATTASRTSWLNGYNAVSPAGYAGPVTADAGSRQQQQRYDEKWGWGQLTPNRPSTNERFIPGFSEHGRFSRHTESLSSAEVLLIEQTLADLHEIEMENEKLK